MNKKRMIATGIFIFLIVMQMMTMPTPNTDWASQLSEEFKVSEYRTGGIDQIALLQVDGAIIDQGDGDFFSVPGYQHQSFLRQLEKAFSDNAVRGVVLYVNSPGGGVYESDEIFNKIVKLKEEYNKPLTVYMAQMAASGGYYISAPADKIIANRNTITGSIGVIFGNLNFKELMDNYGVKDNSFTSGPNKSIMSPFEDLTEEQRQIMQTMVDEVYEQFVDVIVEGRGMDRATVKRLGDGRIYTGPQALENGLVDELGDLDTAIDTAADLAGIVNPTVIMYQIDEWSQFRQMFSQAGSVLPFIGKDQLSIEAIKALQSPANNTPRLMYVWDWQGGLSGR